MLLLTIEPVILSETVYNLCGVVDNAMFGTIMSIQGHKESEYAALLGIVTGKYDTLMNVPLAISRDFGSSLIPSSVLTAKTGTRRQVHELRVHVQTDLSYWQNHFWIYYSLQRIILLAVYYYRWEQSLLYFTIFLL